MLARYYKSMKKKIIINCEAKDTLSYKLIQPLQEDYKELSNENLEKLCNIIIKRGIRAPSIICKVDGEIWALDTHQRLKAYEELELRGYDIPDIPVFYSYAKDKDEAKQILLEIDSRFGKSKQDGFEDFISGMDTDFLSDLEIPDIDINLEDDENAPKKTNLSPYNKVHVLISFAPEQFTKIQNELEIIKNTAGIEYEQSAN